MSSALDYVDTCIRSLLLDLESAIKGRPPSVEQLLRLVDEIDKGITVLFQDLAPERITDERFTTVIEVQKELEGKMELLRKYILDSRFRIARSITIEIQQLVHRLTRILILVAGGVSRVAFYRYTAPKYIKEVKVPDLLKQQSSLAQQIYNILVRENQVKISELPSKLKLNPEDKASIDEVNEAINTLISLGYADIYIDENNEAILRLKRHE